MSLNEIRYVNIKNFINVKGLKIENFKITELDNLKLDFVNKSNFRNKISIISKNKDFQIQGKSFDINKLINKTSDNDKNLLNIFKNLNTMLSINIDEIQLDRKNKIYNLNGDIKIKKNDIYSLNLSSNFSQNEKLFLKIVTNKDKSVITNFYSDKAEPFVKKYKFIKGFEDGHIDFQSTKKK